jgi:hypothetical protein
VISVGPTICTFDQERMLKAHTVLLVHSCVPAEGDIRLPTVGVVKSRNGKGSLGTSVCGWDLMNALWALGEEVDDPDYRIIYIEEENE